MITMINKSGETKQVAPEYEAKFLSRGFTRVETQPVEQPLAEVIDLKELATDSEIDGE